MPTHSLFIRSMLGRAIDHAGLRGFYRSLRVAIDTSVGMHRLRRAVGHGPLRIVVGAGGIAQDGWIATEVTYLNLLKPEDWERFFARHKIDAILAEHVWEHLTLDEALIAAQICRRYIKPGGYLRLAVPDGNHPDPAYIDHVKPGGTGPGANDHKVLYDYKLLTNVISEAGFAVQLLEYFDDDKIFVARPWHPAQGMIRRSARFDERNRDGRLSYTSLIIDAFAA